MSQKQKCICGAETDRLFAVPIFNPPQTTSIEDRFHTFGLCLSCTELLGGQVNLYQKFTALQKMGVLKIEPELTGYAANITKAGETGGEGETGIVVHIVTDNSNGKTALIATSKGVYQKKLENIKKIYTEGGAKNDQA